MILLLTLLSVCSTAWSSEPMGYRRDGSGSFEVDPAPRLTLDAPRTCWKTPLPDWSNASAVVVGDRICTTSEPTDLLCLNREDGELLWREQSDYVDTLDPVSAEAVRKQLEVAEAARTELLETQVAYSALRREIRRDPSRASELDTLADRLSSLEAVLAGVAPFVTPPVREIIGYASATPVSDGTHLFGVFGNGVVSSFTLTGERVWSVWLGPPPKEMNGYHVGTAASPRLVDGVLIVAHGQLVGMDPATGEVRWRLAEPYVDYGTPTVVELGGVGFVALPSGEIVRARDGVVVARGLGGLWFIGPLWDGERLYYLGGEGKAQIAATGSVRSRAYGLRLDGDVITPELQWQTEIETGAAFYSAPVRVGDVVYLLDNDAQLSVIEARSGRVVARESLQQRTALGQVYAPLVTSAGSVYIAGEQGGFAQLVGGRTPELVGHWEVGGSRAGPWVDGNRLYVRGLEAMVCLEGKVILWLLLGCFGSSAPDPKPAEPGADARVGAAARGDGDRVLGEGLPEGMEGARSPARKEQCAFTSSNICYLPVPRATLWMGAQATDPEAPGYDVDASPDEGPVRQVEVEPFWIHKHEVTAVEFQRCLDGGGCKPESVQTSGPLYTLGDPDKRSHPVNGVTWDGAAAYCAWIGGRLPTETEWELAARGTDGRRFPWGNEPACGTAASRQQGVWSREMNQPPCKNSGTLVVSDMRGSSPYDLVGMAGNVLEWVADPYAEGLRGLRGGSWIDVEASDLRSAMRHALPPDQKLPDVGFRCAL